MKLNIGDSIKTKDGRNFEVVDSRNGYFYLKDSEGKIARIKDSSDFTAPTEEEIKRVLIHLCKNGYSEETMWRVCGDHGINPDDFKPKRNFEEEAEITEPTQKKGTGFFFFEKDKEY